MEKVCWKILFIILIPVLFMSCSSGKYTHKNFFELIDDGVQKYQFHKPANRNEEVKYPVLIHLHGRGENESTLAYWYFYKLLTGYKLIDDLINKININSDYESYVVLPVEENEWGPDVESIKCIINMLINEESIDQNRIYITGVSMGGFATSDFIFAYPDIPACAVMICGCNYNSDKVSDILNIPIRIYHSDDDDIVSVNTSRNFYNELVQSGGKKAEYFEVTGYRHSCWTYAFNTDILEWIYLQNKTEVE